MFAPASALPTSPGSAEGSGPPGASDPISVRIPEAIRLTGISRSRLYELMKSGDVDYAKVGASTLILVDSLRRFIEGHRASDGAAGVDRPG